jgi:hypothetical protein
VQFVEVTCGWVYDGEAREFNAAVATHAVDEPDAFGRPTNTLDRASLLRRGMVRFQFRFVRLSAGTQNVSDVGVGAEFDRYSVTMPEGVLKAWDSTESRGYFEGTTAGLTATSVSTTRRTVQAGIQLQAMAARLPGGKCRVSGTLSVSSFKDTGLDTSQIDIPIEFDGVQGQWARIYVSEGLSGDAGIALRRLNLHLSAAGSAVALEIRVD